MCDGCRNSHPLGPYLFTEYEPYVNEEAIQRVVAESARSYVDPAKQAAALFEVHHEQAASSKTARTRKSTRRAAEVDGESLIVRMVMIGGLGM